MGLTVDIFMKSGPACLNWIDAALVMESHVTITRKAFHLLYCYPNRFQNKYAPFGYSVMQGTDVIEMRLTALNFAFMKWWQSCHEKQQQQLISSQGYPGFHVIGQSSGLENKQIKNIEKEHTSKCQMTRWQCTKIESMKSREIAKKKTQILVRCLHIFFL